MTNTLNIHTDYLDGIPNTPAQLYNGKKLVIIHNTATYNATAAAENSYFHNNWVQRQAFVHAFVDWLGYVYENAPVGVVAWGAGNANSYGWLQVEQCISTLDDENQKSAENVAQYVAHKIKETGEPLDNFYFISHADASRDFGGTDHNDTIVGVTWAQFIDRVTELVNGEQEQTTEEQPKTTEKAGDGQMTEVFRCDYAIKARTDGPDTTNRHVYTFKRGDVIRYDRKLKACGYEWISQRRGDGSYWYIPIRELKDSNYFGTFEK